MFLARESIREPDPRKLQRRGIARHVTGRRGKALLGVVSLLLLLFLFSQANLAELAAALGRARPEWLVLGLAATVAASAARVLRWGVLLHERGGVRFWKLAPIQMAGIAMSNFTPGKVAEPLKVVFLRRHGFRYSFALLSVAWERLFDLLLLGLLSLGVVLGLNGETQGLVFLALVGLLVATFVLHYRLETLAAWLSGFRLLSFLREFEAHRFQPLTLAGLALGTVVIWSLDFLAAWAAFVSVGVAADYLFVASAFSASVLLGVVSFLPGGLGSTEAAFLFFLSATGYPVPQLLAGVVLARLVTMGFSSALGLALLPWAKR
jgi:uncharacterized protein (TIRG00374 family)